MIRHLLQIFAIITVLISGLCELPAQDLTSYDVTTLNNPTPGYLMTTPTNFGYISLYDNSGKVAYYRDLRLLSKTYNALRVLENGKFAFFDQSGRTWIITDENFNFTDSVKATSPYKTDFHCLHVSSQGNYLLAAVELKPVNMRDKISGGNPNANIENNIIQEIDPEGNVLFQWSCYDYVDVLDATEDIDLLGNVLDPYHINQAIYDTDGHILANFRNLDAIIKINRTTGNIIWIMGGSASKINQFTFYNDTYEGFFGFSHQHDPKRLSNGNILLYDNGNLKPTHYSRAVEYQVNEASRTVQKVWEYRSTPDVVASWTGNVQRYSNGNTLIGWGTTDPGTPDLVCTEVTNSGEKTFEMRLGSYRQHYQVLRHVFKMNAVTHNINSTGGFNFNNSSYTTGVLLNINSLNGSGYTSVEKHNYMPRNIAFSSIQSCNSLPYRWVVNNRGITSFSGRIFFDLSPFQDLTGRNDIKIFYRSVEGSGNFQMLESTFNSSYNRVEANINGFGEFLLGTIYFDGPKLSLPGNLANQISTSTSFRWKESRQGCSYRIQISKSKDFDSMILDSSGITTTSINTNKLKSLTKYHWRVQAFQGTCESSWSETYSFTTLIGTPMNLSPIHFAKDTPTDLEVKWTKIEGADSYTLQVSELSDFSKLLYEQNISDTSYHSKFKYKPMTKYYWRVAAGNKNLFGNWSQNSIFTTSNGKAYLWFPFNNSTGIEKSDKLIWELLNGISHFRVQVATDSLFDKKVIDSNNIQSYEIQYKNLANNTIYYWRVKGYFKDTATAWSDVWKFKTQIAQTALVYPPDNAKDLSMNGKVVWSKVPGADSYELNIAFDDNFKYKYIEKTIDSNSFNYFSSDLLPGFKYYWRIRALEGKVSGEWSEERSFSIEKRQITPTDASNSVEIKPLLSWHPNYGDKGYDVAISTDSSFQTNTLSFTGIRDTFLYPDGLEYNQLYYWSVKKSTSSSFWSYPFTFSIEMPLPFLIYPNDHQISDTNAIVLRWGSNLKAENFHLQISRDSLFKNILVDTNNLIDESFQIPATFSEGKYHWRVRSQSGINKSKWTNERAFSIEKFNLALISPHGGEVWYRQSNEYPIKWNEKLGDSVKITLIKDAQEYQTIAETFKSNSFTYLWKISSDVSLDSNYQILVKSLRNSNYRSTSSYFFTVTEVVGIKENNSSDKTLTFYPNPADNKVTFEIYNPEGGWTKLKIFDSEGRLVRTLYDVFMVPGKIVIILDSKDMNPGAYFYNLNTAGSEIKGTMLIVR